MIGIVPTTLQTLGAEQAHLPKAASGVVSGVVWRDFSPNSSNLTTPQAGEDGLPDMRLALVSTASHQIRDDASRQVAPAVAETGTGDSFVVFLHGHEPSKSRTARWERWHDARLPDAG